MRGRLSQGADGHGAAGVRQGMHNPIPLLLLPLAACAGGGDSGADGPPLAAGVRIEAALLAQNTGVPLATDGAPVTERAAPVIAGRGAVLRVELDADGTRAVEVRAEVLDAAGAVSVVAAEAVELDGDTRVELALPADAIAPGASLALSVVEAQGDAREGDTRGARLPEGAAFLDLDARETPPLHVVLVPLTVDGAGPALDDDTVALYEDVLLGWYPTAAVTVSVSDTPLERGDRIRTVQDLADEVFALGQRRQAAGAPWGEVWYGVYDATTDAGLAGSSEFSPGLQAAAGPGGTGDAALKVMGHEIAHLMGALHTPACDPDSPDPRYPDPDGAAGVETLDPIDGGWLPADTPDIMGYCRDFAMSPYTSARIHAGLTREAR